METKDTIIWKELDDVSVFCLIELPPSELVLVQAIIESHENLGLIRTIDRDRGWVAVITTAAQSSTLEALLFEARSASPSPIRWRIVDDDLSQLPARVVPGWRI